MAVAVCSGHVPFGIGEHARSAGQMSVVTPQREGTHLEPSQKVSLSLYSDSIHYVHSASKAYEGGSVFMSSASLRMAARQLETAFWSLCHMNSCMEPADSEREHHSVMMYKRPQRVPQTLQIDSGF